MNFVTTPLGDYVGKREPQTILKTNERDIHIELGCEGKFTAKSIGWDENRVFLAGNKIELQSRTAAVVLTHLPSGPRPAAELLRCYLPGD